MSMKPRSEEILASLGGSVKEERRALYSVHARKVFTAGGAAAGGRGPGNDGSARG
jgi:hypothetical protein